ncbi:MAG: heme-binding protein [Halalkalicoccus sp.]
MNRRTAAFVAAGIALVAAASVRNVLEARSAERVDYELRDRRDGAEIRRYPRTVLVETTAPDERTAFNRLFRYIGGANEGNDEIAMTAPVRTDGTSGTEIPMTAPVRTDRGEDRAGENVTMAFYLPAEYDREAAPVPTEPQVRLVVEPPRTLAVVPFSWYASAGRIDRATDRLERALAAESLGAVGEPFLLRYDPPLTPPFLRTNEVAIEVEAP